MQHPQTTPGVEDPVPVQRAIPAGAGTSGTGSIWDQWDEEEEVVNRPENNTAAAIREFDNYLREPNIIRKADPLKWWHKKKETYPR